MLHADRRNPRAQHLLRLLQERLGGDGVPQGVCVTIGGDGWLLSTVRELGTNLTYLGVNAGRLGFLLNDVDPDAPAAVDALAACIREQRYRVFSFPMLQAEIEPAEGGEAHRARAVNDVFVERVDGAMALLRVRVGGTTVVEELTCDGLIVATALGSTAYSFSAGGVPSHPQAEALHITPICPHTPRLSPFVLPRDVQVEIEVLRGDYRPVRALVDGIGHGRVRRVRIHPCEEQVRLAFRPDHDFTATMIRKVLQA
ncbi:NAD(+)/NADH kinase [Myxococcota bacterium]|nr:NAD(+)/NADH kinase [Myxococcota bacterium]